MTDLINQAKETSQNLHVQFSTLEQELTEVYMKLVESMVQAEVDIDARIRNENGDAEEFGAYVTAFKIREDGKIMVAGLWGDMEIDFEDTPVSDRFHLIDCLIEHFAGKAS